MATTYLIDFGPLVEVPSDFLKKLQSAALLSRAAGASNTLANGLDSPSTNHYGRSVVYCRDKPATAGFLEVDSAIDWRDRQITVSLAFDRDRDIRPGEVDDKALAKYRGRGTYYTSSGNIQIPLIPQVILEITALGALRVNKDLGYLHMTIEGSVQLKERS